MTIITLSREYGSGGDEIAQIICRETGYQYFDKEMIAQAAIETGIAESGMVAFDEQEYRAASFIARLLRRQEAGAEVRIWREDEDGIRKMEVTRLDEDQVKEVVQNAIVTAYRSGNFVIVGRGGQAILRNLPDVLHVRVTASIDERIRRVRNSPEFAAKATLQPGVLSTQYDIRLAAQDLIETHDAASQDYLKRNYGVNWNDPVLYDVVINTTRLDLETAAQMIIEGAKRLENR